MNYFKSADAFLKFIKNDASKLVFTNGCFDIIHVGHVRYLAQSKALGEKLIVGLNSDASVRKLKGDSRPVNSEEERAEVLLALSSVDFVILFNEDTPFKLINSIKPAVLTKGGDYVKETIVGADIVEESGGKVVVIPFVEGKSTSKIISEIKS